VIKVETRLLPKAAAAAALHREFGRRGGSLGGRGLDARAGSLRPGDVDEERKSGPLPLPDTSC